MTDPLTTTRRTVIAGFAGLIGSSAIGCTRKSPGSDNKPNHVMILIDDLNDWVTVLGGHPQTKTPNIDRLAKRGTVFANAHAQAPICGPSRASLMSGRLPAQSGIYGQIHDDDLRDAMAQTSSTLFLPNYLNENGYATAGMGKVFHRGAPDWAFDTYIRNEGPQYGPKPAERMKWFDKRTHTDWGAFPETDADMLDHQTAKWGSGYLQREHENPFFLALGMVRPHVPWHAPKAWFDLFPPESLTPPPVLGSDMDDVPMRGQEISSVPQMPTLDWAIETKEWPKIIQAYLASIAFVDSCVGTILDSIDSSPYADNTYITLLSDNGYHIGEKQRFAKMSLWERSTRVPLIMAGPDIQHSVVTDPVGLIDVYPTLVGLSGLASNPENAGRSLIPYLKGTAKRSTTPVTSIYGFNNVAVIDERYRYIRYDDGSEELYDHLDDPNEWNNRADDASLADVKKYLSSHLPQDPTPSVM